MACRCFGYPCEHGTTLAEHAVERAVDPFEVIAVECPRGTEADIPPGWEWRYAVAASTGHGGFKLWTDGAGRWLRVDSDRVL